MATASRSLATALQGRARSRLALPSYTTSWDVTWHLRTNGTHGSCAVYIQG